MSSLSEKKHLLLCLSLPRILCRFFTSRLVSVPDFLDHGFALDSWRKGEYKGKGKKIIAKELH